MMRTALRLFILPWYLVGWVLHAYFGLFAPQVYQGLGSTAMLPGYEELWSTVLMPHITLLALLAAGDRYLVRAT